MIKIVVALDEILHYFAADCLVTLHLCIMLPLGLF